MLGAGKLPNLAKLIKEGGLVETSVVTGPTQTKPGWAEILTGYSSGRLQILSNKEYRPIPKGYTVFERLKARFGGNIAAIFIAAKPYNLGSRGPHEICSNAYTRDPVTMVQRDYLDRARFKGTTRDGKPPHWVRREGEPYFNAVKAVDEHIVSDSDAATTGAEALAVLEKYRKKPFFAFVHFREPDEEGHQYGENSPEYGEAIGIADRQLGAIVEKLKQLGIYSKTVIFVTSDHGMDEGKREHRNAPFMVLASNCARKMRSGDRKDVTPTILDWYGFDLGKTSPPMDGRSLFIK
jgi:predicted AlkP superfamily pyrophosphatase or phosphodiesterase